LAANIRIWRALMPASKFYLTNCTSSAEYQHNSKRQRKLIDLFILQLISESFLAIDKLQGSHIENMKGKARKLEGLEEAIVL
ncbi:hypothetical protein EDC94DRAFT_493626, partial [Helicostylum pulchrum]